MELTPWKPFGEVGSLRKEMDNLWDRFFGEAYNKEIGETWAPSVDISETKDTYVVKAELPGLDANDIKVSISGDMLTLKGEKKKEKEEKDENFHRMERYCGSFQRVFRLPTEVKTDKIKANFDKGILKVVLPKVEEAKQREVEVKVK